MCKYYTSLLFKEYTACTVLTIKEYTIHTVLTIQGIYDIHCPYYSRNTQHAPSLLFKEYTVYNILTIQGIHGIYHPYYSRNIRHAPSLLFKEYTISTVLIIQGIHDTHCPYYSRNIRYTTFLLFKEYMVYIHHPYYSRNTVHAVLTIQGLQWALCPVIHFLHSTCSTSGKIRTFHPSHRSSESVRCCLETRRPREKGRGEEGHAIVCGCGYR